MVTTALSWETRLKLEGVLADKKSIRGTRNLGNLQVHSISFRNHKLSCDKFSSNSFARPAMVKTLGAEFNGNRQPGTPAMARSNRTTLAA
ncbi:uncharacterized protein PgNI_03964 [Pyricularia grisea]|uniref:Uncharacterized protein n=1 Tax=Pyricularia grisea TaxID=148305 RepID=A0A6P8B994_PYRGI|nr:uncharacterized protein PgNI_03964 [Pyricularia grisea]TLD12410.1 hypothetical protein PgNI_03964 [Pyricularia grisea]